MVRKKTNFVGSICSSNIFYTTESRSQVDSCGRCLESILQKSRETGCVTLLSGNCYEPVLKL